MWKIGHSKGFELAILTLFLTRVFAPNFDPIWKTLGMAELPSAVYATAVRTQAQPLSHDHPGTSFSSWQAHAPCANPSPFLVIGHSMCTALAVMVVMSPRKYL